MEIKIDSCNNKHVKDTLFLSSSNWDDFGYKTLYQVQYIDDEGYTHFIGDLSIATIDEVKKVGQERSESTVKYRPGYRTKEYLPKNIKELYGNVISLGNLEYYENIKEHFNPEDRERIYDIFNDLAFNTSTYEKYKKLDVVKTSFMRGVSEYTLLNQFNRIALGGVVQIPYSFELTYKVNEKLINNINFNVNPDSLLPTNVYGIIGNNGAGKTTLIKDIAKTYLIEETLDSTLIENSKVSLSIDDEQGNNSFESVVFISYSPFDLIEGSFLETINLVKMEAELLGEQISFNYIGNSEIENEKQAIKSPEKISEDLFENLKGISRDPMKMKRWTNETMKLSFDFEISKFINSINSLKFENSKQDKLLYEKINKLSSGQKMILVGVSALINQVTEKTLVIIDEPESFLHPPLISAYIRILSSILYEKNGVALISTHSPIIIQEIPDECVWILKKNREGILSIDNPSIETFGGSIGVLMDEVFGHDIRNAGFYRYLQKVTYKDKGKAKELLESNLLGRDAKIYLRILLEEF